MNYCTINVAKLKRIKTKREATIERWEQNGYLAGFKYDLQFTAEDFPGISESQMFKIRKLVSSYP